MDKKNVVLCECALRDCLVLVEKLKIKLEFLKKELGNEDLMN